MLEEFKGKNFKGILDLTNHGDVVFKLKAIT